MSNVEQIAIIELLALAMFLVFMVPYATAMYGPTRRKEAVAVVLNFWLPSAVITVAAIDAYFAIAQGSHLRWLAVVGGVAVWLGFLCARRNIHARQNVPGPGRPPNPKRLRATVRSLSPGRLILFVVICVWAIAGIVGSLITFLR